MVVISNTSFLIDSGTLNGGVQSNGDVQLDDTSHDDNNTVHKALSAGDIKSQLALVSAQASAKNQSVISAIRKLLGGTTLQGKKSPSVADVNKLIGELRVFSSSLTKDLNTKLDKLVADLRADVNSAKKGVVTFSAATRNAEATLATALGGVFQGKPSGKPGSTKTTTKVPPGGSKVQLPPGGGKVKGPTTLPTHNFKPLGKPGSTKTTTKVPPGGSKVQLPPGGGKVKGPTTLPTNNFKPLGKPGSIKTGSIKTITKVPPGSKRTTVPTPPPHQKPPESQYKQAVNAVLNRIKAVGDAAKKVFTGKTTTQANVQELERQIRALLQHAKLDQPSRDDLGKLFAALKSIAPLPEDKPKSSGKGGKGSKSSSELPSTGVVLSTKVKTLAQNLGLISVTKGGVVSVNTLDGKGTGELQKQYKSYQQKLNSIPSPPASKSPVSHKSPASPPASKSPVSHKSPASPPASKSPASPPASKSPASPPVSPPASKSPASPPVSGGTYHASPPAQQIRLTTDTLGPYFSAFLEDVYATTDVIQALLQLARNDATQVEVVATALRNQAQVSSEILAAGDVLNHLDKNTTTGKYIVTKAQADQINKALGEGTVQAGELDQQRYQDLVSRSQLSSQQSSQVSSQLTVFFQQFYSALNNANELAASIVKGESDTSKNIIGKIG